MVLISFFLFLTLLFCLCIFSDEDNESEDENFVECWFKPCELENSKSTFVNQSDVLENRLMSGKWF